MVEGALSQMSLFLSEVTRKRPLKAWTILMSSFPDLFLNIWKNLQHEQQSWAIGFDGQNTESTCAAVRLDDNFRHSEPALTPLYPQVCEDEPDATSILRVGTIDMGSEGFLLFKRYSERNCEGYFRYYTKSQK